MVGALSLDSFLCKNIKTLVFLVANEILRSWDIKGDYAAATDIAHTAGSKNSGADAVWWGWEYWHAEVDR
jgi:hypothetical protein